MSQNNYLKDRLLYIVLLKAMSQKILSCYQNNYNLIVKQYSATYWYKETKILFNGLALPKQVTGK